MVTFPNTILGVSAIVCVSFSHICEFSTWGSARISRLVQLFSIMEFCWQRHVARNLKYWLSGLLQEMFAT